MIGTHVVTVTPGGVDLSCLIDTVAIRHGRDDTTGQPDASSVTLTLDLHDTVLPAEADIGATVTVTTTIPGQAASTRFVGRITDVDLEWADEGADTPNAGLGQIIAVGALADLGRRIVGDAPFPQELDGARVSRVLALAGVVLDPGTSDPGKVQILPRDIDSTDALDVAQATASDAGGILWQTRAGEIRYADAEHRRNAPFDLELDACDLLVTPSWHRNLAGLVNKASIGYGPQPDEGDQPRFTTDNAASIARFGRYELSTATELATLADASALANMLTTRNAYPVWIFDDVMVDVDGLTAAEYAGLLALDVHSLLRLTGLPVVAVGGLSTASLWVEGIEETLAFGVHSFALSVSGFCRTTPPPRWNDIDPAWTWDTIVPASLTWDQASCFGPPTDLGRWDDVPASIRWDSVPPGTTWDTWDQLLRDGG